MPFMTTAMMVFLERLVVSKGQDSVLWLCATAFDLHGGSSINGGRGGVVHSRERGCGRCRRLSHGGVGWLDGGGKEQLVIGISKQFDGTSTAAFTGKRCRQLFLSDPRYVSHLRFVVSSFTSILTGVPWRSCTRRRAAAGATSNDPHPPHPCRRPQRVTHIARATTPTIKLYIPHDSAFPRLPFRVYSHPSPPPLLPPCCQSRCLNSPGCAHLLASLPLAPAAHTAVYAALWEYSAAEARSLQTRCKR